MDCCDVMNDDKNEKLTKNAIHICSQIVLTTLFSGPGKLSTKCTVHQTVEWQRGIRIKRMKTEQAT